jgi:hypothetical protein
MIVGCHAVARSYKIVRYQVFTRQIIKMEAVPKRMLANQAAMNGGSVPDRPRDIPKA